MTISSATAIRYRNLRRNLLLPTTLMRCWWLRRTSSEDAAVAGSSMLSTSDDIARKEIPLNTATDREETRCDNSICEITCPFSRTRTHTHKWFVTQVRHPRRCCLIWRQLAMTDKLARYRLWLSEQLRWLMVKIWRKYFFLNLFYQTRLNVKIWHQSDSCRGVLNYATCLTLRSVFSYSCNKSGWGRTLLGTEEHKIDSFASHEIVAQYRRKRIFAEKH